MDHPKPMTPFPNRPNATVGPVGESSVTSFFEPLLANFGWIGAVIFIAYSLITIYELLKHQKNIAEIFSQNNNQISLKWLYALPALFVVIVLLNFVNENALDSTTVVDAQTFHMLSFLSFIILLCFFGVKQKPVFSYSSRATDVENEPEIPIVALSSEVTNETDGREENQSEMSDEAIAQTIEAMQTYMRHEKPYLNPDFSVYDLAAALNTPRRTLSQMINSVLSKNFYQLVNEFRIEEVKDLLKSQDHKQLTILEIAFQSGFKSKSSFNSLFKQYCKMTPSQYRKAIKQENNSHN
jgi:AraC-like DNA-binding protein